jgi:acyl carrier protein
MTTGEIRNTVLRMLCEVAPEADPAQLRGDIDLRDQLDIDSMDLLNFVISVDEELGVAIPESDYRRFSTLNEFVAYLAERMGVPAAGVP